MAWILPPNSQFWPADAVDLTTEKVVELYTQGNAGAFYDPDAKDAVDAIMRANGQDPDGGAVAMRYGFAESGAGKLTVLFPAVTQLYGYEALTWPGQKTGDCVSMQKRDVALFLTCIDALSNTPDEVTGIVEAVPEVSEIARKNGVFANEPYYIARGHNGQGMSCDQALRWAMTDGGIVLRKKYPQVDLESYNVAFEKNGRAGTPDWLEEEGKKHQIRNVTRPRGHEQSRDYIAIGCCLGICSGLGFSSSRDENGFSRRQGGWAHSWHVCGYDDRATTKQKYGFPLALAGHRWAKWNSGGRRIMGTQLDIPEGYWWFDARLLDSCWISACNSVNGWPAKKLPDFLVPWG
jgi:hypothetical protein